MFIVMMVAHGGSKTNSAPEGGDGNSVVVVNPGTGGESGAVTAGDGMNAVTGGAATPTGPEPLRRQGRSRRA